MNYLIAAYTAIWVLIFIYTLYLGHRQSNIVKELDLLKGALKEKSK